MSANESLVNKTFIQNITHNIRTKLHGIDALSVGAGRRGIRQSVTGQIQPDHTVMLFEQSCKFRPDVKGFQISVQQNDGRFTRAPLRMVLGIAEMNGDAACGCEILHDIQCFRFSVKAKIDNFQKLGIIRDF